MTRALERLIRAYRKADPKGDAAEYLEDDAKTHRRFADEDHDEYECRRCREMARESATGARLLRAVLRMRLPKVEP